ncbi:knotted carbamoyltransferase YgeW [Desulfonatronum thiosulfatophilum]|uniref:Knotted carbamoyltransferase YgeW n=1 Tax=Desulfonatronum thiosulfatophilum TaxID=617002 RepID=A0A1G6BA65_9BACT|nr:knotted carbamoyltransferase YgeW [Desulfonatronum thiosulfatophilum]SDB17514.1 knotted carbamoyltransferase YgeW [Desulfonatronum thiosulfatophilum]
MDKIGIEQAIRRLADRRVDGMHHQDFLLTWEKSMEELAAVFDTAEILRAMRGLDLSPRLFDSGLAISIFRDNSTRTRFSFAAAANLLGLTVQDLDEEKSQIAHGETVRETANMVSFMAEAVGIRDDIFLGQGNTYMREVAASLQDGYQQGVLPTRPTVVNLQCDLDHPTQTMADALHLINHFGGLDKLRGKKIAMTWAYSPSYGKPLSVAQGVIGLMTRLGMDVVLGHPEGYNVLPEVESMAGKQAAASGGSFQVVNSMAEAFADADIVYPKSWAPFAVMQERTELLTNNDTAGLKELEKRCLENNKRFVDWECTEELMRKTRNGDALYMHCLPADISGVSCKQGEVQASVFERHRINTYKEAGYKPYVVAAMILLARLKHPADALQGILKRSRTRRVA